MENKDVPRYISLSLEEKNKIFNIATELGFSIRVTGGNDYPYDIYCTSSDLDVIFELKKEGA